MAIMSVAKFRTLTGATFGGCTDSEAGLYLGIASSIFYGLTGKEAGGVIEGVNASGSDVVVTCFGHLLPRTGTVFITDTGSTLDGQRDYVAIDDDTLRIDGITLNGSELPGGRVHRSREGDVEVYEDTIRLRPCPVLNIVDIRVECCFPGDGEAAYGDETILAASEYYVAASENPMFRSEVVLRNGTIARQRRRRPGFVLSQVVNSRRVARVKYFTGTVDPVPAELCFALADVGKTVFDDPGSGFASESLDYYSYSRRSLSEMRGLPHSSLAIILKYQ